MLNTFKTGTTRRSTMTRREAESLGFTVDTHCYPWVAYKGPRFNTTVCVYIRTPAWPKR